jgi:hypothetical protein
MAVAQQQDEHGGAAKPGASEQHPMAPGGAAQHAQPGGSAQKQMPEKGAPKGMSQAEQPGKAGVKPEEHAQTPAGGKPEGSAQTEQRGGQNAAEGKAAEGKAAEGKAAEGKAAEGKAAEGKAAEGKAAEGKGAGGKSVQLSDSQRTQIKSVIGRGGNVARVNSVNFNITVGTAVPRDVHFVVLPADVVTIVPEYQGFDYIIVGDQLLIIDPVTLEIVAILPA